MWLPVNDCAFHYKYKRQWGHFQNKETLRLWELREIIQCSKAFCLCATHSYSWSPAANVRFPTAKSLVWRTVQDKLALCSYNQTPGQEKVIEMDFWKTPPESLSSGNMNYNVFLREVVRNTGSRFSEISPWGNKHTIRSYFLESTKEAPKLEFNQGHRIFQVEDRKIEILPPQLAQGLSLESGHPRQQRGSFIYIPEVLCRSPRSQGAPKKFWEWSH